MQETIVTSVIITTMVFVALLIVILLLMKRYYNIKAESERKIYIAVLAAQENERYLIAQNIHDELGGILTSAKLTIEDVNIETSYNISEHLEHISDVIDMAIITAKNASNNLTPPAIEKYGLFGAILDLPNRYKSSGIKFNIQNESNIVLSDFIQINLYRIINEAVNNSIKYAQARLIDIKILDQSNNEILLIISDDGIGFDYDFAINLDNKHGLKNISNRCAILKATLNIDSAKNQGCTYTIRLKVNL